MPIVNASETRAILKKHNIHLTKRLGQHFLTDGNILKREIDAAVLSPHDTVIEIGPGIGTLTEALVEQAGQVIAIEFDPRFLPILKETLGEASSLMVVEADAMRVDLASFGANKLVANLPYNIGSAVITKVLEEVPGLKRLVVMVQKEVAARLVSGPGSKDYGVLAITVAAYATARSIAEVKRTSFLPAPDVDSSLVVLDRLEKPRFGEDTPGFIDFVKELFVSRRKTVRAALTVGRQGLTAHVAETIVAEAGLTPSTRAETLSPEDLFLIFAARRRF